MAIVETVRDGDIALYQDFDTRYLRKDHRFSIERRALKSIPVIDLSPFVDRRDGAAERARVAREIRSACVDVGFFYISGHGIEAAELDEAIAWGHRLFTLPNDVKMAFRAPAQGQMGYMRIGGIDPDSNPDKEVDLKERFLMSRELFPGEPAQGWNAAGTSRWPDEKTLPGFACFMRAHIAKRTVLAQRLVRALALSLDLSEDYFDEMHRYLGVIVNINYYPPIDPARLKRTQWSFSPHTDYAGFTLLSQDSLGGLQVRNTAGEWIDVPPIPGTFVVNLGDLFATWTNDLYTSNLHRALNLSGEARVSIPFFVAPQGATLVQCLETCQGPGNPPRYAPVTAGDYVRTLREQAARTGRAGVARKTAERMQKQ